MHSHPACFQASASCLLCPAHAHATCIHAHAHMHMHIHNAHMHMHTCTCTGTCTRTAHGHGHTHAHVHAHGHAHGHAHYTHARTRSRSRSCTCTLRFLRRAAPRRAHPPHPSPARCFFFVRSDRHTACARHTHVHAGKRTERMLTCGTPTQHAHPHSMCILMYTTHVRYAGTNTRTVARAHTCAFTQLARTQHGCGPHPCTHRCH